MIERLRALPQLEEGPSQWTGATAFWLDGREIVHFHSGEVEVRLTRKLIGRLDDPRVARRTRTSDWVIVPAGEPDLVVELTREAIEANS